MLLVSFTTVIFGCGGSTAPAPALLPLTNEMLSSARGCRHISSEGAELPVSVCETPHGSLFVTAMQQCGVPDKFSYQATTRQLLVGITNLEFVNQTPVPIGDRKVLRSTFRGMIDAEKILGATFTHRSDGCITDLVVWKLAPSPLNAPEEIDIFTRDATELAFKLRPDELHSQGG